MYERLSGQSNHIFAREELVKGVIPNITSIFKDNFLFAFIPRGSKNRRTVIFTTNPQNLKEFKQHDPTSFYELVGVNRQISDEPGISDFSEKSGGRVYFHPEGILINRLSRNAADIWIKIASGDVKGKNIIPCAPILTDKSGNYRVYQSGEFTDVASRYCGLDFMTTILTLRQVKAKIDKHPDIFYRQSLYNDILDFENEIYKQKNEILNGLEYAGLDHGHPHYRNFTVEFWPETMFNKYRNQSEINSIYTPDITFDLQKYFSFPGYYRVVTRIIDFDRIKYADKI